MRVAARQVVPFHQPRKFFSLLIRELEHDLDLAVREYAYVRGVFFREETVQALALLDYCLAVGGLPLGNLFAGFDFFFRAQELREQSDTQTQSVPI